MTQYTDVDPTATQKLPAGQAQASMVQGQMLFDSMLNLVSGLGMSHDKNTSNQFVFNPMGEVELENSFRGDWIARKVVLLPAEDSVRQGRNWQTKKDNIEKIELEEARLKMWEAIKTARILGRLYGGGAVIVGGPGNPDEPLLPSQVTRGGLKYLLPVSRYDLRPVGLDVDLMSPWFGEPMYWELQLANQGRRGSVRYPRIHPSRVIRFFGNKVPPARLSRGSDDKFWSDSVLQVVKDAIAHAAVAQQGIAGLVQEAKLDVVRIPGLMEHLSTADYTQRLTQRFMYAAAAKSSQNTLILDSEEQWERKQINFTQLPDILKLYLQIASGASSIPATLMVGLSPQGLNATGETEERVYYDRVKSEQKSELSPAIATLDEMVKRSALGKSPRDIYYVWAPLWQMSEKEASAVSKQRADTMRIIAETNLIPMDVLARTQANQLIEDGQFPGFEAAFEENGENTGPGPVKKTEETEPPEGSPSEPKPAEQEPTGA
jgi:phage-related protein (TIGR01555 family)